MKKTYKVAEHCFSIEAGEEFPLWSKMEECYGPFEVHISDCDNRFALNVGDYAVNCDQMQLVYSTTEIMVIISSFVNPTLQRQMHT